MSMKPLSAVLLVGLAAQAQDYRDHRTVVCASNDGRRSVCDAFTGGGVRLVRQLSQARCEEGYSWGYTERDIWVDRGCRAEFSLESRGNVYPNRQLSIIRPGTILPVRTNETIASD